MHTAKAAQTFKIHFIDVGCADAALLQYGEGTEAKYALIDTGANQYHNTRIRRLIPQRHQSMNI